MWSGYKWLGGMALTVATLLSVTETSSAQRWRGRWYGDGGWGGYGYYSPWYGYSGYGYYPNGYYSRYYPSYTYVYPSGSVMYSSDGMIQPGMTYISSDGSAIDSPSSRAFIDLRLADANAEVWFDDHKTSQMGNFRRYHTPPLDSTGSYQVRVHWMDNGKAMDQVKTINVHPGDRLNIDFTRTTYTSETVPAAPAPTKNDKSNKY